MGFGAVIPFLYELFAVDYSTFAIKDVTPYLYDLFHAPISIIVSGIFHHVTLSTAFKIT
jgi:hypothetical protein